LGVRRTFRRSAGHPIANRQSCGRSATKNTVGKERAPAPEAIPRPGPEREGRRDAVPGSRRRQAFLVDPVIANSILWKDNARQEAAGCYLLGGLRRPSSRLISFAASEADIIRPIFAGGTDAINLALRG
jgi:hypothetical protein